jgi:hypothetical protein
VQRTEAGDIDGVGDGHVVDVEDVAVRALPAALVHKDDVVPGVRGVKGVQNRAAIDE